MLTNGSVLHGIHNTILLLLLLLLKNSFHFMMCFHVCIGHLHHVIWFAPDRSYTQSYKIRLPTGQPFSEFVSILFFFFKCKMLVLLYLFIHFFLRMHFYLRWVSWMMGYFVTPCINSCVTDASVTLQSAHFFVVFFAVSLCACEDVTWSIKVVALDAYLL